MLSVSYICIFSICRPTFLRIYKKKSTEGFQAIPYVVALFSAMLTLYYGMLKPNGVCLITINSIGIFIESAYILLFMIYAPKDAKVCDIFDDRIFAYSVSELNYVYFNLRIIISGQKYTAKLLVLMNGVLFGTIIFTTLKFFGGSDRITVVGWICAIFSVCVFVAPLSIMVTKKLCIFVHILYS